MVRSSGSHLFGTRVCGQEANRAWPHAASEVLLWDGLTCTDSQIHAVSDTEVENQALQRPDVLGAL